MKGLDFRRPKRAAGRSRESFVLAAWLGLAAAVLSLPAAVPGLGPAGRAAWPSRQDVDPFYLKLFAGGEKAFLAGNRASAVRDLEIAVFGLARDPKLAAKAYVYLALCREAIQERDKSRQALARAAALMGPEGAGSLGLDEATLAELGKLSRSAGIDVGLPAPSPPAVGPGSGLKAAAVESGTKKPGSETALPPKKTAPPGTNPPAKEKAADAPRESEAKPPVQKVTEKTRAKPPEQAPPKKAEAPPQKTASDKPGSKPPARKAASEPAKPDGKPAVSKVTRDAAAGKRAAEAAAKPETRRPAERQPARQPAERPAARPVAEPDLGRLEAEVRRNPGEPGPVYELASAYFRRGGYKEARNILEALTAARPRETHAEFLLAKAAFFLKDCRTALEKLRDLSRPGAEPPPGRDMGLKISLYTGLCLVQLKQGASASTFLDYVVKNSTPEQLTRIVSEEGLTDYWTTLRIPVRR